MKDPRILKFAQVLVNHSTKVKPGDKVLIETFDAPLKVHLALAEEVFNAGGSPILEMKNMSLQRSLYIHGGEDSFKLAADCELYRMKRMDCYIAIRGGAYELELIDVPGEKMSLFEKFWLKPVHYEERCENTRWVVTRYPSLTLAQSAKMSLEAYEDYFFKVCTEMNWDKLSCAMDNLTELMTKTERVRIVGPGTDLNFSIRGISAAKCDGENNIPDGEVYTAPVKDSVNGTIHYNVPSSYRGFTFENVRLTFKDGRIVEASANDTERIKQIFDTDEGARYVGEFAIGTNPLIDKPMDNILFDEKIGGSLHFTPGDSIPNDSGNGNQSSIHWDLVLIQTEEYGGGELYFDDVLIRKDGVYVVDKLKSLNKENLLD